MPVYQWPFERLIASVSKRRPAADRNVIADTLNEKMRQILDARNEWNGLIEPVTVAFPAAYTTGTVNFAVGSNTVQGTGTIWPVNDVVNTVLVETIPGPGQYWVTPASMTGITRNSILYVDAGGPNPEILPVQDILGPRIQMTFQQAHAAASTATQSSFAQLQFRLAGYSSPIYTILAVTDPQTLVVDQICGQPITGGGYTVQLLYITLDPRTKDILTCYDPFQMLPLRLEMSQAELNTIDPDRTAINSPIVISPRSPNLNGLMTWEPWPGIYLSYQLIFQIRLRWPDMRAKYDYPPPFMNPNALIYGALADLCSMNLGRPPEWKDPGYSMEAAMRWDAKFNEAFQAMLEADEQIKSSMFTYDQSTWSMGSNYNVSHDDTPWITP